MAVNTSPSTAKKTDAAKARFVASARYILSSPFRARMAFRWGKLCVRKSNKITATPEFLGSIDVTNSLITMAATGESSCNDFWRYTGAWMSCIFVTRREDLSI